MKNFTLTFLAVFIAIGLALFGYDQLIVKPRELKQAEAEKVDLSSAKSQAQEIANQFDQSVKETIGNASKTMNAQTGDMQQRALAADALARASMVKTMIAEYFQTNGQWPKNYRELGMASPEAYAGGAVKKIAVENKGVIAITLIDKFEPGSMIKLTPRS